MAQHLVAVSDSVVTGWTTEAGSSSNLFAGIDESVASDTDYAQTAAGPTGGTTARWKLTTGSDPGVDTGHVLRVRLDKDQAGGDTLVASIRLYQGGANVIGAGTLIATFDGSDNASLSNVPNGAATYELTLTSGEAGTITDYAQLYLEVTFTQV